jgi:two-component system, LytTR family, response regulator
MLSCIIIDDEQPAIDLLTDYANESGMLLVTATSTDPVKGLELFNQTMPDIIFLDIHMPKLSGLDFIRAISNSKCKIVLCTAYTEFATEAYDLDVADYLLKPVRFERFLRAVTKIKNIQGEKTATQEIHRDDYETDYLFVKTETKGKLLKINVRDIDFVEGMKNYVAIHHGGSKTIALLNMKDIEERLQQNHFMRVHKSFIVNLQRITGITGNIVHLKNISTEILLGINYKEQFMEKMKGKLMAK